MGEARQHRLRPSNQHAKCQASTQTPEHKKNIWRPWLVVSVGLCIVALAIRACQQQQTQRPKQSRPVSWAELEPDFLDLLQTARVAHAIDFVTAALPSCKTPADCVDMLFALATVYESAGQLGLAEQQLRSAVAVAAAVNDVGPLARTTPIMRADTVYALAKHLLRVHADRLKIINLLRQSLEHRPAYANAQHWLAHQLLRSAGGTEEALKLLEAVHLQQLTDSDPLDTIMLRGQACERLGDLPAAQRHFEDAAVLFQSRKNTALDGTLRRRFALAHVQLCRILLLRNLARACFHLISGALADFPGVYQLMDMAGYALGQLGQERLARQHYRDLLAHRHLWPSIEVDMMERVFGSTLAEILHPSGSVLHLESDPVASQGGWPFLSTVPEKRPCNIDRVANLSKADFIRHYVFKNRPVLVQGWIDHWPAQQRWQQKALLKSHGDHDIVTRVSSTIALDQEFGGAILHEYTLADFVARHNRSATNAMYLFGGLQLHDDYDLLLDIFDPAVFAWAPEKRYSSALFYLGPAGSGAP